MKWRPEVAGQGRGGGGGSVSTLRDFFFFQTLAVGAWFVRLAWSAVHGYMWHLRDYDSIFFVRDNSTALSRDPTAVSCDHGLH